MARKKKWAQLAGGAALLLLVAAAALVVPHLLQPDLHEQVAAFLKAPKDAVHVNIPPTAGRYPGGMIALGNDAWRVVELAFPNDPDLVSSPAYSVDWRAGAISSAEGSVAFARVGELIKSDAVTRIELGIKEARTFEMTEEKLQERALRRSKARKKYEDLFIITRAVEGIPVLKLYRGSSAGADAWAAVKKDAEKSPDVKLSGDTSRGDLLALELTTRVVVAFEVAKASYYSQSLSTEPDSVKLVRVQGPELQAFIASRKKDPAP